VCWQGVEVGGWVMVGGGGGGGWGVLRGGVAGNRWLGSPPATL